MSKIVVLARVKARQDSMETVKCELLNMVEPTRNEAGCIDYQLHQDTEDPAVFVFYETWESAAALEKHKETDHYRHYAATVFGLIEERVVNKLIRIA
ncbi:MAG: putative quinol monooxygenase [Geobacteraceae bacterium]|nr:putative quinol monooxygenase [Geobacteraceae bacterium]